MPRNPAGNLGKIYGDQWLVRRPLHSDADHVHLFARPAIDARSMAEWIKMWKSISSRKIVTALATSPPIWQADYFDRYLRSSENYAQKWHYVEQNAVRAGLVSDPDSWPYRGMIHDLMF
jgi:putative transposase